MAGEGMNLSDGEILRELLSLQKESNERDTRMETQLNFMDTRLTKTEELLSKMSDTLGEQKHLAEVVDSLAGDVRQMRAEQLTLSARVKDLEDAPAHKTYEIMKKVIWIVVPVIVLTVAGFIWTGIKMKLGE